MTFWDGVEGSCFVTYRKIYFLIERNCSLYLTINTPITAPDIQKCLSDENNFLNIQMAHVAHQSNAGYMCNNAKSIIE
jgi:hypothetical protein